MESLIDRGASLEGTLIMAAMRDQYDRVAEYLIRRGATDNDASALQRAAEENPFIVHLLIESLPDYSPKALSRALISIVRAGHHLTARFLIDRGADVMSADGRGVTLLMIACQARDWCGLDMAMVRLLLDSGVAVNAVDHRGWTALHILAYDTSSLGEDTTNFRLEAGELIIKKGASLQITNREGKTPSEILRTDDARITGLFAGLGL